MRPILLWLGAPAAEAPVLRALLGHGDWDLHEHVLSPAALAADRAALAELDPVLAALARAAGGAGVGVVGVGRAGTLAFLLACARRVAAVVDVDGPVLYPALSAERPTQPIELALNLEGAFLGLFARGGPVGAEERALLEGRLRAAARPHELVVHAGEPGFFDPRASGYDARRAEELGERVRAFLAEHLAPETEHGTR